MANSILSLNYYWPLILLCLDSFSAKKSFCWQIFNKPDTLCNTKYYMYKMRHLCVLWWKSDSGYTWLRIRVITSNDKKKKIFSLSLALNNLIIMYLLQFSSWFMHLGFVGLLSFASDVERIFSIISSNIFFCPPFPHSLQEL